MKRFKWIVCASILLLALLFLETFLGRKYAAQRVSDLRYYHWDAKTLWRLRPNINTVVNGRAAHTNSAGFRGEDEYSIPAPHPLRILVLGDSRTYEWTAVIRSVNSVDAMTADWSRIPYDTLAAISNRIVNSVKRVNRVVFDITSKPPATIEWE